jgi:hypothetical protein
MRYLPAVLTTLLISGCNTTPSATTSVPKPQPAKITQFYAPDTKIPIGVKGNLCYGVEHSSKLELSPAVEDVWPAMTRCFEISPKQTTHYTLTAYGDDGSKDTKTVDVTVGAPVPRIHDLSVTSTLVHPGELVIVCFKVENTTSVKAGPGHFDPSNNCITDNPKKTTVYRISALGGDRQIDTGTVTVKVQ